MKKMLVFLSIFVTISFAQETNLGKWFQKGNSAYLKKDYQTAVDLFSKIEKSGYESFELYFNLGNSYFKQGIYGKAILYFERAFMLDTQNEDVRYNLEIANSRIQDRIDVIPDFFFFSFWKWLISLFSVNTILFLLSLFVLTLFAFIYLFRFQTEFSKRLSLLGIFSSTLLIAFFIILYVSKVDLVSNENYAIITMSEVTVKSSPNDESKATFIIHEGLKVLIVDNLSDWFEIKLADGKKGWLKKSDFELINNH